MRIIVCLLLFSQFPIVHAQDIPKQLDSLFTALYSDNAFNGNVLVSDNGKEVYSRSFGYANAEDSVLNNAASRFHLASVSKIFTATAVLHLKEKGKLKLDDPASHYLPDFPFPAITIRQLLSHTSGLPDFQIFEAPHREDTGKIFTNEDLIPAIKKYNKPLSTPGEKWSYSNTGYGLLVLIVEKVSGMKFQDYLQRYIFKPAGMLHTYIETSLIQVADTNRTINYDFISYAPSQLRRIDAMRKYRIETVILGGIIGPGHVVSTTKDLLQFDKALYAGKILKLSTQQEAFTPVKLNNGEPAAAGWGNQQFYYGLGWMILRDTSMGKIVWHSGGAAGMVTIFLRNLSRHQTVVLLDNVTHRNVHGDGINAMYTLNKLPVTTSKKSLANIFVQTLFKNDRAVAITRFNELKADTAHYYMDERELNIGGLELLWDGHPALALDALQLNTLLYPNSWNVYDSYAGALLANGKKNEAIAMYKKSIAMNPGNKGGQQALQKILSE